MNFTIQDILNSALAVLLFPLVILTPGYVFGWTFDLFNFRKRHPLVRFVIALVLSIAISPILFYLLYRLTSGPVTLVFIFLFLVICLFMIWQSPKWNEREFSVKTALKLRGVRRVAVVLGVLWVAFVIVYLADWQFGEKLYFTVISYDYTTRVSVIDAITRTGVPPVNPSYYPGHPENLTFLYYFWYVICSLVDQLGGKWVDARTALAASVAWCGLGLISVIALYLRERNHQSSLNAWKTSMIGAASLTISGLDILPVALYISRYTFRWMWGDIEHWNEQITAWLGSVLWVPLHVASLIACIAGLILFIFASSKKNASKLPALVVSGLAFASAFGLSVWVTLVFALFWGIWFLNQLVSKQERKQAWLMIIPGLIAILAISPFIFDIAVNSSDPSNGNATSPFFISVREFFPVSNFVGEAPVWARSLAFLAVLPINYIMELGFFFVAGLLWIQLLSDRQKEPGMFFKVETLLLGTTFFLASFLRSSIILSNDFGWRSWLAGQFVLLVWGVDIFNYLTKKKLPQIIHAGKQIISTPRIKKLFVFLAVLGILTTFSDLVLLRIWPMMTDRGVAGFPHMLSRDNNLGKRTLAARQAYKFLDENLPKGSIIQFNPKIILDRPSGLYRTSQAVISTHTLYGVSSQEYAPLIDKVSDLFGDKSVDDWSTFDQMCEEYQISAILLSDYDPIWNKLQLLKRSRMPLFENKYFAVFSCDN